MRAQFIGTCAKELDRPEANEDAYALSVDQHRFALSDGASESYDSQSWAQLLSGKLAEDPNFDQDWLESAVSAYQARHDFNSISWSHQLALERGCFATLLGVEHDDENRRLSLLGVGDSIAVLLVGTEIVRAWPLDHPDMFKDRPTLLSTLRVHNKFTQEDKFELVAREEWDLARFPEAVLLCMTDALGEWMLRFASNEPEKLSELLAIRTEEQLKELVLCEREAKRMRVDDATLAILKFDIGGEDGIPVS